MSVLFARKEASVSLVVLNNLKNISLLEREKPVLFFFITFSFLLADTSASSLFACSAGLVLLPGAQDPFSRLVRSFTKAGVHVGLANQKQAPGIAEQEYDCLPVPS
jgi:hypothetical protein